jgi:acetolactate synthase-1/2/3 large subunit
LVITDRVGRDIEALEVLDELSREFAIAVRATRHRMNIRDDHPGRWAGGNYTSAQTARNDGLVKLSEADAVLALEHAVPWIPARERPGADAWVGFAGVDPAALQVPLYEFPSDLRLTADPAQFLRSLLERMRSLRTAADADRIERRWVAFEEFAATRLEARDAPMVPGGDIDERLLSRAMAEILEPDDALTWEMTETSSIPRTRPDTIFESGGSSLGWSVAAGMGIRMADRGRFVASLVGDGAYQFGSPSIVLWAQTRYDVPVLTVVANNRGYRTGTVRLREDYPDGAAVRMSDYSGGVFDPPADFAAEAEAAGGFGARVTEPGRLVDTLKAARHAVEREGRPAVVDVWLPPLAPEHRPPQG